MAAANTQQEVLLNLILSTLRDLNVTIGGGSATEATLQAILAKDTQIEIDTTNIDLNTDGLEALIGTTNTNQTNGTQQTKITDGTDIALVTAAGEINVLATAQPGVDIGDTTINNGAGAAAVNIQDGGNSITVDGTVTITPSGTQDVNIISTIAIPVTDNGSSLTVDAVDLDIRDLVFATDKVDVSGSTGVGVTGTFFQATQPVSATDLDIRDLAFATDKVDITGSSVVVSSSALPTGAATAANQATEIASLAAIDAGIPAGLGQTTMAASMPVVLASDQTAIPMTLPSGAQVLTSTLETAATSGTVTAGATSVMFTTDATFTGSINAIARSASTAYAFEAAQGKTLPAIAWVVTTGNMNIDKLV